MKTVLLFLIFPLVLMAATVMPDFGYLGSALPVTVSVSGDDSTASYCFWYYTDGGGTATDVTSSGTYQSAQNNTIWSFSMDSQSSIGTRMLYMATSCQGATINSWNVSFVEKPTILTASPLRIPVEGGGLVYVRGTEFIKYDYPTCRFEGSIVVPAIYISVAEVACKMIKPLSAAGTITSIEVANNGEHYVSKSYSAPDPYIQTYNNPVLQGSSSTSVPAQGSKTVQIFGASFANDAGLICGARNNATDEVVMGNVLYINTMIVQCTLPSAVAGNYTLQVGINGADLGRSMNAPIIFEPCTSGQYSLYFTEACQSCPAGTYAPQTNSSTCLECEVGTYAGSSGASTCLVCPSGTFQSRPASSSCSSCVAGTVSIASNASTGCVSCPAGTEAPTGSSECKACSPGSYSATAILGTCSPCPGGTYQRESAQSHCLTCQPGYYAAVGSSVCSQCEGGTYSGTNGTKSCASCDKGTYAPAGRTSCQRCAIGSYADQTGQSACTLCPSFASGLEMGSASIADCFCNAGYYGNLQQNGDSCEKCPPEGALCPEGSVTPSAVSGYTLGDDAATIYNCNSPEACKNGTDTCNEGYTGEQCERCAADYYRAGRSCIRCYASTKDSEWYYRLLDPTLLVILIAICCVVAISAASYGLATSMLITWFVNSYKELIVLGMLTSIVIQHFQLTGTFIYVGIPWGSFLMKVLLFFDVLNFNFEITGYTCFANFAAYYISFAWKSILFAGYLLGVYGTVIVTFIIGFFSLQKNDSQNASDLDEKTMKKAHQMSAVFNMLILSMEIMYTPMVAHSLFFFSCTLQGDGSFTLDVAEGELCYSIAWFTFLPMAILCLVFGVLLPPILIGGVLIYAWHSRNIGIIKCMVIRYVENFNPRSEVFDFSGFSNFFFKFIFVLFLVFGKITPLLRMFLCCTIVLVWISAFELGRPHQSIHITLVDVYGHIMHLILLLIGIGIMVDVSTLGIFLVNAYTTVILFLVALFVLLLIYGINIPWELWILYQRKRHEGDEDSVVHPIDDDDEVGDSDDSDSVFSDAITGNVLISELNRQTSHKKSSGNIWAMSRTDGFFPG
jgi:hypothetical protein